MKSQKLILLPGLGADGRLFDPQRAVLPGILSPDWPAPVDPHEPLCDYARRMAQCTADSLRLSGEDFWLGGASFGGMVALEMACHLPPRGVFLIASCRTGRQVPRSLHWIERGARLIPDSLVEWGRQRAPLLGPEFRNLSLECKRQLRDMFLQASVPFLRWGSRALLEWDGPPHVPAPVHHIHGAKDRVIPISRVRPDVVIADGGHLINVTHADPVNRFLLERIR